MSVDEIESSILHFGKDISKGVPAPNLPYSDEVLASIAPDLYLTNYTGPRINMADIEIGVHLSTSTSCPFAIFTASFFPTSY